MNQARTYLYVPGDSSLRLERSGSWGADAVMADLEDSVSSSMKAEARGCTAIWAHADLDGPEQKWVRLNAGDRGIEDLEAVWSPNLYGVCVPKSSAEEIRRVDRLLSELEGANPLRPTAIMPLIESAGGLLALPDIARSPRVERIHIGEIDLAADLGLEPCEQQSELLFARSQVVLVSRAADLLSPVGGVHAALDDLDVLVQTTVQLRRLGFGARAVIHPNQIGPVRGVFEPSSLQLEEAARLVEAFERADRRGEGVFRDANGQMIDEAVVRRSRQMLASMSKGRLGP